MYGSFAAKTLANRLNAKEFRCAVDNFVQQAEMELGQYYKTKDVKGNEGVVRHIILSEVLICPECDKELSYFENGTKRNPVQFTKTITCPHCGKTHDTDTFKPALENIYDSLLKKEIVRKKREPVWVYGTTNGKNWDRKVNDEDRVLIKMLEEQEFEESDIPREICWGELHRTGYHLGITHLHQFYTKRNYTVMFKLWKLTERYPNNVREALQLLLLSYNSTHCTLMTRVVAKRNAKDFVLTGAQSGVLYISKLPVEKNILLGLKRKSIPFEEAYGLLEKCTGELIIHNSSSEKMLEKTGSIDFVFTDPPFGDFIPYAEVNQINELWLNHTTDREKEIIISPSQEKSVADYQWMLTRVFTEISRVLKPDHYAAVVFHAAKAKIWEAFEHAILDSGLAVCMTSIQGMRGLPIIPWQSSVHKDLTQRLIRKQRLFPKQTLSVRLRFGVYKNCMFSKNKIIQCKIDRKHPTSMVGCFSFALKIVIHYGLSILSSAHRSGRSSVQGHKILEKAL